MLFKFACRHIACGVGKESNLVTLELEIFRQDGATMCVLLENPIRVRRLGVVSPALVACIINTDELVKNMVGVDFRLEHFVLFRVPKRVTPLLRLLGVACLGVCTPHFWKLHLFRRRMLGVSPC